MIELEVKARVPRERLDALRRELGPPLAVEEHADAFYAHPARDLAATDEALRLSRRAERVELTYKGPKLDERTKARREVTLAVHDARAAEDLLEALGFARVAEVRKTRRLHERAGFEVALDEVPGLGWFVEVERALPDDAARGEAEREAFALLASWGIAETERRSYLELLHERPSSSAKPE